MVWLAAASYNFPSAPFGIGAEINHCHFLFDLRSYKHAFGRAGARELLTPR